MDLKELEIIGDSANTHWYYLSKGSALELMVGKKEINSILDIGAGSGYFSKWLLNHHTAREALCVDPSYQVESDALINGKHLAYRRSVIRSKADLVLMMDVLEHVDNDVELIKEYIEKVDHGTRFIITVPAFQWLWSKHDVFLEHKRRYSLSQLESTVRKAGLSINYSAYYFGLVLPIAIATRLFERTYRHDLTPASQLRIHNPFINRFLISLCRLELSALRFNTIGGLTIFCLATRT